jgi:hypothetical protein
MTKLYCTDPFNLNIPATTVWIVTYEIRGKLRGNLECGSAQPSLSSLKTIIIYYQPIAGVQHTI